MKSLLIAPVALLAVAGFSTSASAEAFNGPFVGAQVGWNHDDTGSDRTSVGRVAIDANKDAAIGGIFAGYDYKVTPKIVIGAEAGFDLGVSDSFTGGTAASAVRVNPKYAIDLTARAGYLVTDNTLVYVRGGYSNVRAGVRLTEANATSYGKDNRDAWVIGGGVERAITPNVSARLEYRYADLGEGNGSWDRHQVLLGAAYHF